LTTNWITLSVLQLSQAGKHMTTFEPHFRFALHPRELTKLIHISHIVAELLLRPFRELLCRTSLYVASIHSFMHCTQTQGSLRSGGLEEVGEAIHWQRLKHTQSEIQDSLVPNP